MRKKKEPAVLRISDNASLEEIRAACGARGERSRPNRSSGQFREKLRGLWQDRRPFSIRASLALLCALAFAFTFVFFGPCELYIQNIQHMEFPFSTLVSAMALTGLCVFALLFALLCILRGKVFNCALSGLFAVTLAGYLQRNFLNVDHGPLDGRSISWVHFASATVMDFLVWIGIVLAVFVLLYFSRRVWTYAVRLVCVMLVFAQSVAFVAMTANNTDLTRQDGLYPSTDGLFNVSTGNNVVFFLYDSLDNNLTDEVFVRYPEIQEALGGFTYYRNFTGSYLRTVPSVAYLLTGQKCDYTLSYFDYFSQAYQKGTFLPDIVRAGNKTRIYTTTPNAFGVSGNVLGLAENIRERSRDSVSYPTMLRLMLNLSAYVYAPEAFKPFFWMYTGELSAINRLSDLYELDDPRFWNTMRQNGITREDATGMFTFYHLNGAHGPFSMNERGEDIGWATGHDAELAQVAGGLNMLLQYIDMLKEAGLYDNTTIIISADHGCADVLTELNQAVCPALLVKPAGADDSAPMAVSEKQVNQDNLRASIISYFGLDSAAYGRTIESVAEDEDTVRYFWFQGCSNDLRVWEYNMITYEIRGDANLFENWTEVDRSRIESPYYGVVPGV